MGCTISFLSDEDFHAAVRDSTSDDAGRPVSLKIMDRGVRLKVARDILNQLSDENRKIACDVLGRAPSPGEVVVHGLVKTIVKETSYSEFLKNQPESANLVGQINVFVSHAWGLSFKNTVHSMEEFEKLLPADAPTCFYFIDFFAVNQYNPKKDLDKLGEIAKKSQKLLLIASPWERPAPLGRAWCIFELANAVLGETELVISLPGKERRELQKAVKERLTSSYAMQTFLDIFTNINSAKSQASVEEDRLEIFKFIENKLDGFNAVDQKVATSLRRCIGMTVWSFCETWPIKETKEHAEFLMACSFMFAGLSMHEYNLKCSQQAHKIYKAAGDGYQADRAENSMAVALGDLGRYSEAVALQEAALEKRISNYGLDSLTVCNMRYNLAYGYTDLKQWEKAEVQIRTALRVLKKKESMSPRICIYQAMLATILRDGGKDIDGAATLFKEILDYEIKAHGDQYPKVQVTASAYARCLELKGLRLDALEVYKKAFPIILKKWGKNSTYAKKVHSWIEGESKMDEKKE